MLAGVGAYVLEYPTSGGGYGDDIGLYKPACPAGVDPGGGIHWLYIGPCALTAIRAGTGLGVMACVYIMVGLGDGAITGDAYVAYGERRFGLEGGGNE